MYRSGHLQKCQKENKKKRKGVIKKNKNSILKKIKEIRYMKNYKKR